MAQDQFKKKTTIKHQTKNQRLARLASSTPRNVDVYNQLSLVWYKVSPIKCSGSERNCAEKDWQTIFSKLRFHFRQQNKRQMYYYG